LYAAGEPVMRAIRLIVEEPKARDDRIIASARLEYPRGRSDAIWFSMPRETEAAVTRLADPFVLACFMQAMSRAEDLRVTGVVSPALVRNLERVQTQFASWWPAYYRPIEITADRMEETTDRKPGVVAGFSGGMDSCYTLFRHIRHRDAEPYYDIRAAVMVHGFDIPLKDRAGFAKAADHNRAMASSLGIPLFDVATTIRDLSLVWEHSYGAALAAALSIFSAGYGRGLIASSHQVKGNILGSHPETDPLFSSGSFEIVHDGAYVHKLDKSGVLKDWPEAMKHLRVCWEGKDPSVNCGCCEKCIRTILVFRAKGLFPSCFSRDVSDEQVRTMKIPAANLNGTYIPLLNRLRESGIRGSWVTALEENVAGHLKNPYRKWKSRLPAPVFLRVQRTRTMVSRLFRKSSGSQSIGRG
jgi:hypothetical protein